GDRIGLLEARPRPAQPVRGLLQIVDPQREVAARMEAEIAVRGKVHMARNGCYPDPGSFAQGLRPGDLAQAEPLRVEPASCGFLARRIEHLRVMQRRGHDSEFRPRIWRDFGPFFNDGATIPSLGRESGAILAHLSMFFGEILGY